MSKIFITPNDDPTAAKAEIDVIAVWEMAHPNPSKPPIQAKLLCFVDVGKQIEYKHEIEAYFEKCVTLGSEKYFAGRNFGLARQKFDMIAPSENGWYVSIQFKLIQHPT